MYLCVDFESCDGNGTWIAGAAGVFQEGSHGTPSRLVEAAEFYMHRPLSQYDDKRRQFWLEMNASAHAYIEHRAGGDHTDDVVQAKERAFCVFLRSAHDRYPSLKVVSDNPQFDLSVCNTMLRKHGFADVNVRSNGAWLHPICTFSYALAAQQLTPHDWWRPAAKSHCALFQRAQSYPSHTPLHDICMIMSNYFYARLVVETRAAAHRQQQQHEFYVSQQQQHPHHVRRPRQYSTSTPPVSKRFAIVPTRYQQLQQQQQHQRSHEE